jgi:hypothetical protein
MKIQHSDFTKDKIFESFNEFEILKEWNTSTDKVWSFKLKDGRELDVIKVELINSKNKSTLINFKVDDEPVKHDEVKHLLKPIHQKKIEMLLNLIEMDSK